MHHLKETIIDGVKFVLIPSSLYENLTKRAHEYFEYTGYGIDLLGEIKLYEDHPHVL